MVRRTLSKISATWLSLTISGGVSAMRVAGDADHQALVVERLLHGVVGAPADGVGPRREVDAGGEADAADVEHVGQALERS